MCHMQACEHYMDAGAISDVVKGAVKAKEMLDLETTVLQCLSFDLVVYEPYLCIDAMIEVRRQTASLQQSQSRGDAPSLPAVHHAPCCQAS